jgi:hypothetical protein
VTDPESYPVPPAWAKSARVNAAKYTTLYGRSLADPGGFWLEQARRLDWVKRPEIAGDWSFDQSDFHIRWFADGRLNVSVNCIDRHLKIRPQATAILWEPDDPTEAPRKISYAQLHAEVCRFANVLKANGVAKGDRVTLYMPMIPEAAFAMLACARIGAVHSVVFGGFSPEALASRIQDCGSRLVVTADAGRRGGRRSRSRQCRCRRRALPALEPRVSSRDRHARSPCRRSARCLVRRGRRHRPRTPAPPSRWTPRKIALPALYTSGFDRPGQGPWSTQRQATCSGPSLTHGR